MDICTKKTELPVTKKNGYKQMKTKKRPCKMKVKTKEKIKTQKKIKMDITEKKNCNVDE
jgi:hypothetical protein